MGNRKDKVEILDDQFDVVENGLVESKNVRFTFRDGGECDVYLDESGTRMFITANGIEHSLLLRGARDGDFEIQIEKIKRGY